MVVCRRVTPVQPTMHRGRRQLNEGQEGELLCLLARVTMDSAAQARARQLLAELDWDVFRALAVRHGVLPLIYRSLVDTFADATPEAVLASLRQTFHRNAWANLGRIRELKRLLSALSAANVPALVLKGPAVAELAYGDPGLRSYGDLDILVPVEAFARAVRLVRERGYTPLWPLNPLQERVMLRHGYHYNLCSQDGLSHLEIHWRAIDPCFAFALPDEDLWRRKVTVALGSDLCETLAPEDQLLFLCLHGAKHFWSSLKMVCDVAELVNRCPTLDWTAVGRTASRFGSARALRLGLRLAEELVGARLSEEARGVIGGDRSLGSLERDALGFLALETPEQLSVARMATFHLRLFPTLASKARYLRASFAPKELDVLTFRLPTVLSPLYLLLRPLRLLFRLRRPMTDASAVAGRIGDTTAAPD